MKKILALLLASVMALSLAACGGNTSDETTDTTGTTENNTTTEANPADAIPDTMTSEDGTYELAFVTDVGQLKDKSFNEGTWNGVKLYANENDMSYKYYQPANGDQATDDDRYDAMKAAVDAGATVVVCAGFLQEAALTRAAIDFPDVQFIFVDGYPLDDDPDPDVEGNILTNVAGIAFEEAQSGYFAGYAAVMEGYTKLGFSGGGGGTNPACCRYGYGFVQGANAAAAEKDVQVEMNYSWQYGSNFSSSPELQTMANGWYQSGTEVIFACGGSMFQSISAAAAANDGAVIGVDVDQSGESETVITSAMKGLGTSVYDMIAAYYNGSFPGGENKVYDAANNGVALAMDTAKFDSFAKADYDTLFAALQNNTNNIASDILKNVDADNNEIALTDIPVKAVVVTEVK